MLHSLHSQSSSVQLPHHGIKLPSFHTQMALTTTKLSELPLLRARRNSLTLTFTSHKFIKPSFPFLLKPFSSLQNPKKTPSFQGNSKSQFTESSQKPTASSWINKWPSSNPVIDRKVDNFGGQDRIATDTHSNSNGSNKYVDNKDKGQSAIQRIVLRLRNLGLGSDDEDEDEEDEGLEGSNVMGRMQFSGEEKLGDLLKRDWVRPDSALYGEEDDMDENVLPWEKDDGQVAVKGEEDNNGKMKRRIAKAPSLAELTIEDSELRRLRGMGMKIRERINVAKAGVTQAVIEKIHDTWRKEELVRLKFHETLAHDMKTAHEIVERRTGGLIIWRSGSVMVVYRGSNYEGPAKSRAFSRDNDALFVPDASVDCTTKEEKQKNDLEKAKPSMTSTDHIENMSEEEAEYNQLLDGLGPRFDDWWGTGVLPVDADKLPKTIPGYKTPFRLLPTGMRSSLTNAELTNLRKLARSLPSHFALGRNREHQGLAAAIIKLWEKSLVAKIAVKRGIQNTNNKLMAEEIKNLTGGVLLLRNKYYIVIYRGKDFLPPSVAAALAERQELTKQIQDVEETVRSPTADASPPTTNEGEPLAGTLAEFYEAQARWGREISDEERQSMIEENSRAKRVRVVQRIRHKLELALAKKIRAEKLLSKIEANMVPVGPSDDQETITDEERFMFRRVGLRMTPYLPIGIRGVFDGVIENMHLHWKHRELVKLISKQKNLAFVEHTARLLEHESGGILVAIEPVPKGFAVIYYRGKNYRRPISIRPRNLLTKAKALKRSVAMQRHEALSQHISELERTIEQMEHEIGDSKHTGDVDAFSFKNSNQFNDAPASDLSESDDDEDDGDEDDDEDEDSFMDFDSGDDKDE